MVYLLRLIARQLEEKVGKSCNCVYMLKIDLSNLTCPPPLKSRFELRLIFVAYFMKLMTMLKEKYN